MFIILMVLFVGSALLIIPVVLLQGGKGADVGVFTGGMTSMAFGARANEILVNWSWWLFGIFLASALSLSVLVVRQTSLRTYTPEQSSAPVPAPTSTSATDPLSTPHLVPAAPASNEPPVTIPSSSFAPRVDPATPSSTAGDDAAVPANAP